MKRLYTHALKDISKTKIFCGNLSLYSLNAACFIPQIGPQCVIRAEEIFFCRLMELDNVPFM